MEKMKFEQLNRYLLSLMGGLILYEEAPDREKVVNQLNKYEIPAEEWEKLLIPTAKLLGFQLWEEDNNLMLIPGYLYQFIPAGLDLYCISGEKVAYESYKDLDNDCRFGCLAYGLYMEEHA